MASKKISNERLTEAGKRFLEARDYLIHEVITVKGHPVIVAEEDDTLVFAKLSALEGEMPKPSKGARAEFEKTVFDWLREHPEQEETSVRGDRLDFMTFGERAFLKLTRNATSAPSTVEA